MYVNQSTTDEVSKKLNNVEGILCDASMTTIERVIYWGILKDSSGCGFSDSTNEELASTFSCTRRTILRVVACLRDKGYIRAEYGKGNARKIYPLL